MKIVEARLKTAQAIAKSNGDENSVANFDALLNDLKAVQKDPYFLPDVLTPPEATPTVQEVHDAVQAGEITPEAAADAGMIPTPDAVPPADSAPPFIENTVPTPVAESPAPEPDVVPADPAPPVIPPADATAAQVDAAVPEVASDGQPAAATDSPASADPVNESNDPGDEDPTPPENETIASLDARVDALEGHPRKVSRQ